MALPSQLLFLLLIYLYLYLASSSNNSSSTCSELDKKFYENWLNLPTLNATLGYTYKPRNASLSVVFMATPPSPNGWIAWGINPNGQGMVGAEVFAAFRENDIVEVKTFRLQGYYVIVPRNLSFDVWDVSSEGVGDVMKIYAKVKIPDNVEAVNHTWQIGSDVVNGIIGNHSLEDPNINSKGKLCLLGVDSCDPAAGKKITHATMSTLGWGVLQLIEIFLERCRNKLSSPSRRLVNLHNICQFITYITGIMGCGVGLILENESELIHSRIHSTVGIAIIWISTTKLVRHIV